MKHFIALSLALFLFSCASKKTVEPVQVQEPAVVQEPSAPVSGASREAILEIAKGSDIAKYSWKNRGKAPLAYIQGMALVYARAVCNPSPTASKSTLGLATKDALAHYGIQGSNINTYAFVLGLGMRESSGKFCTGRDASATNTSAETAESGMFQTSYNSSSSSPELKDLINRYTHSPRDCFREVFEQGVTCSASNWKYWGKEGPAMDFQILAKTCPAFAAEYVAPHIRVQRSHYGPIIRKEVEFRAEAIAMLQKVEDYVKENPTICEKL